MNAMRREDMNCPSQEQLISFVCNEETPEARAVLSDHVESCPTCAEQVAFLAAVANHVRSAEPTAPSACPDEDTLCAFVDGSLPKDQEPPLIRHLLVCEKCRRYADDIRLAQAQALSGPALCEDGSAPWRFVRIALPLAAAAAILLAVGFAVMPVREGTKKAPAGVARASYVTIFRGEATDIGNAMVEGKPTVWAYDKVLSDDALTLLRRGHLDTKEGTSLLRHLAIPQLQDVPVELVIMRVDQRIQTTSSAQPARILVEKCLGIYRISIRSAG